MNGTPQNNYPEAGSSAASSAAAGSQETPYGASQYGAASAQSGANPYPPVDPGAPASAPYGDPNFVPPYAYGAVPPPPPPGTPNPGLATLLGFIPGVGAMYNGQFAKGLAHIVVFAVFISLANHVSGLFGLLITGWLFYMVFDAYQTARARRDGLVLPDPFGLNNIGERFGINGSPNWGDFVARPANGASTPSGTSPSSNPYAGPPVDTVTGAPVPPPYAAVPPYTAMPPYAAQGYPAAYPPPPSVPPAYAGTSTAYATGAADYSNVASPYAAGGVQPNPYTSSYAGTYAPVDPAAMPPVGFPPANTSGLPTGAIWLIGLGVLALVGSLAHNVYWSGHFVGTFFLLALGIILLVQRTIAARTMFQPGTAAYQWNLLHQNRGGIYLVILGVLQAVNGLHIAGWNHTWPYLLISIGLLQVLDRTLHNRMLAEANLYATAAPPPVSVSPGAADITPDQEVR